MPLINGFADGFVEIGRSWRNRCTLCPSDHLNPRFIVQNCWVFLSTLQYLWDFCWTTWSSWLLISSATHSVFCTVRTVLGRPLPAFQENNFIVSILCRRSLTELNCPLLVRKLFTNAFWTPSLFLSKEFNWQLIFIRERQVYQRNNVA